MKRVNSPYVGVIAGLVLATGCGSSGESPSANGGGSGATGGASVSGGSGAQAGSEAAGGATAGGANHAGSDVGGTGAGAAGGDGVANGGSGGGTSLGPNSIASLPGGTCAIDNGGRLRCWGANPTSGATFSVPDGEFVAVGGESFLCGRRADGSLRCFQGPSGQLPPEIEPSAPCVDFDTSPDALCALDAEGKVACKEWLYDEIAKRTPTDETFSDVALGRLFACGIRKISGQIQCWGFAGIGNLQCGEAPSTGQLDAPPGRFVQIASAEFHSCAIKEDGSLACWGAGDPADDPEQLLCEDLVNYGQATPPPGSFVQVSVGIAHSCAVKTDGSVACWGAGKTSDGCGTTLECGQSMPPPGTDFVQVSVGYTHSCAMRRDRSIACWGSNSGGRSTPPADFP